MNLFQRPTVRIFRTVGNKTSRHTYTEFAKDKAALFDRWCASREIVKDFKELHQLILIEEFKSCLPINIKTYIDEQKAESLEQATVLADDYSLTHMSGNDNKLPSSDATHRNFPTVDPKSTGNADDSPRNLRRAMSGGPICNYCKR